MSTTSASGSKGGGGLSTRAKVVLGLGAWLGLTIVMAVLLGSYGRDMEYKPQEEFKLVPWWDLPGPMDINKGSFYIVATAILTCVTMLYVANRMEARPNRVQTAIESLFGLMRENITRGNMADRALARKWFPFLATLFLFIWFANLFGYLPLPTNTKHKVGIFGYQVPSFALYAATANVSMPLVLALVAWVSFNYEGVKAKGLKGYLKSLLPPGVPRALKPFMFGLEIMSNLMRLLSLSVRLFANILAGHMIILFMSGALVVILGVAAVGIVTLPIGIAVFAFEVILVATLQAFIFATLTAIYIGEATAASH